MDMIFPWLTMRPRASLCCLFLLCVPLKRLRIDDLIMALCRFLLIVKVFYGIRIRLEVRSILFRSKGEKTIWLPGELHYIGVNLPACPSSPSWVTFLVWWLPGSQLRKKPVFGPCDLAGQI